MKTMIYTKVNGKLARFMIEDQHMPHHAVLKQLKHYKIIPDGAVMVVYS